MRYHLFEFHDQSWFPAFFRDELTLFLNSLWSLDVPFGRTLHITAAYKLCGTLLKEKLEICKQRQIVDICSGAGGPLPKMASWFAEEEKFETFITLTDLFPNVKTAADLQGSRYNVKYILNPIDASFLPKEQSFKFRTSFGSFHHLPEPVTKAIFQDVVNSGCGLGIFEGTGRDLFSIIGTAFVLPLICAYAAIFEMRPITFTRILFFFIIPIMPLLIVIDGTLSNLRTYDYLDYMRILATVEGALEHYEWEYVKVPVMDLRKTWLNRYWLGRGIVDAVGRLFLLRVFTGIPKSFLAERISGDGDRFDESVDIPLDR